MVIITTAVRKKKKEKKKKKKTDEENDKEEKKKGKKNKKRRRSKLEDVTLTSPYPLQVIKQLKRAVSASAAGGLAIGAVRTISCLLKGKREPQASQRNRGSLANPLKQKRGAGLNNPMATGIVAVLKAWTKLCFRPHRISMRIRRPQHTQA